jgi:hypothetical protein
MNINFYFYKHNLTYKNVLIELLNTFINNLKDNTYKNDYYENYEENYEENYYENNNYDEKLYGDYDDWEDYYSSIYD